MSKSATRCDQIIRLIDSCLAECEISTSVERRFPSGERHPALAA